jgi:hypothetical protein
MKWQLRESYENDIALETVICCESNVCGINPYRARLYENFRSNFKIGDDYETYMPHI